MIQRKLYERYEYLYFIFAVCAGKCSLKVFWLRIGYDMDLYIISLSIAEVRLPSDVFD